MASGTYRYEISNNNRALCQNSACKKEGVKIQKGEFRFGSLVVIQEHSSWRWKHWGCVTPLQIENILSQIGGLEGLDDGDLGILDGYDELTNEAQEKVKYALRHGHVHDDDWKGDPELNRPGMKGINKRAKKKKDEDESATESTPAKPKRSRKKKADEEEEEQNASPTPKSKKKSTSSNKRKADDNDNDNIAPEPQKRKRTAKKNAVKSEDLDSDEPLNEPVKKSRSNKKAKEETTADTEIKKPETKSRGKNVKQKEDDAVEPAPMSKPGKASRAKKVKQEDVMDAELKVESTSEKTKKKGGRTSKTAIPKEPDTANAQLDEVVPEADARKRRRRRGKVGGSQKST